MRFNSQMESHVVWCLLKVKGTTVVWLSGPLDKKVQTIDSPDPWEIGPTFYPYTHKKSLLLDLSVSCRKQPQNADDCPFSWSPLTDSCPLWQTDRKAGRQTDRESPLTDSVVVSLWGCPPAVLCITTPNWWRCPLWQTAVSSDREESSLTDRQTGVLSNKKVSSSVHCCSATLLRQFFLWLSSLVKVHHCHFTGI